MSLKIIHCEEPTISSFCSSVMKQGNVMKHSSVEESKARRSKSLVLGKVIKIISFSTEAERFIILFKEFLPSNEYGGKFRAVVEGPLARQLVRHSPQTGDRLAFLEPHVFSNPSYESENTNKLKYLLECNYGAGALMWFAKKQEMGGKSDDDQRVKQVRTPGKNAANNASEQRVNQGRTPGKSATNNTSLRSKQAENEPLPGGSTKQNTKAVQSTDGVWKCGPLVQPPQQPQIPVHRSDTNSRYKYKTINSVITSNLNVTAEQTVNLFGIVKEILKPFTTTKKNKYTLVCWLLDDSNSKEGGELKFHFFTPEDTIIKEIDVGDILRLHRVRLESYRQEVDGRVFFSHDIVLFKKDWPKVSPITIAKNTILTDDDKRRVETLRSWYSEYLKTPISLPEIVQCGRYNIFCKLVLREPRKETNAVRITVTDGREIENLNPALPLKRYNKKKEGRKTHIVTEVIARSRLDEYARLKLGDFVLLSDVEAVQAIGGKFSLEINSDTLPEVTLDKTLEVQDIECRLKQYTEMMSENEEAVEVINIEDSEEKSVLETNQDILPSSSDQGYTFRTRQQKDKQKTSPGGNSAKVSPGVSSSSYCDNKSDLKSKQGLLNAKDDCDRKNDESDPGTKSRKLFTPNYRTDLSDATDETSECNVEVLKHPSNKIPEDVVNPANTTFVDIVEKVKNKFCSPRRPDQTSLSQEDKGSTRRSSSRKIRGGHDLPSVTVEGQRNAKVASRKRDSQEELEDAETIINVSCQASGQGNKRTRLDSLSSEDGNPRINDADVDDELESRGNKVTSWLLHPNNKLVIAEDIAACDFGIPVLKQILGCDSDSPDMSKYISSAGFRIKAFLLETYPDPSVNPLDLVSGYCHSGCQQVYLYSTIKWLHQDDSSIPLCPACIQIEKEQSLKLMLMMELSVMDTNGLHSTVVATRNQAEQFLNCSVAEFVKDEVIRKSRVQLLTDYTVQSTYRSSVTPMLDIQISPLKNNSSTFLLLNSTLKLPRI